MHALLQPPLVYVVAEEVDAVRQVVAPRDRRSSLHVHPGGLHVARPLGRRVDEEIERPGGDGRQVEDGGEDFRLVLRVDAGIEPREPGREVACLIPQRKLGPIGARVETREHPAGPRHSDVLPAQRRPLERERVVVGRAPLQIGGARAGLRARVGHLAQRAGVVAGVARAAADGDADRGRSQVEGHRPRPLPVHRAVARGGGARERQPLRGKLRPPRHDVDDAPDRVAAVQNRGGAAEDLDRGDARRVDESRLDAAEVDRLAAVVQALPVDEHEHAIAAQAAQHRQPEERPLSFHLEPGLERKEIGDHVVRLEPVDPLAVQHVDGSGDVERRPLRAGGDGLDLLHVHGVGP